MVKIFIDGRQYEVEEGNNLLDAALSLKLDIPYFCWHPAMGSVGACRQCAVKQFRDENDTKGRIVMSCMVPVSDGLRVSIEDEEVKSFRSNVIEWLMTNHPHDCPICDEGGECHLQDMTVMTGHTYRRYDFKKRTHINQYLGPFINHEMNRCIQCYRCVRYYRDYAGGDDLNVFASRNNVYFGRDEDGVLESEFSGNLAEVCPTGVFTDKTSKQHYTRKWDLTTAPSVCFNCGLGCNIIAGERYGTLRRVISRYNSKVNGYFICDRGRFGYEYVNGDDRFKYVTVTEDGKPFEAVKEEAVNNISGMVSNGKTIGIGSPRASLESNYALRKLVGKDNFFVGINKNEFKLIKSAYKILKDGAVRTPSLKETEESDAVLILGEDLTNTAPMLALAVNQASKNISKEIAEQLRIPDWQDAAVREAVQDEKSPVFIATPAETKLDRLAEKTYRAVPNEIARFGFAVANAISGESPEVSGLSDELKELVKLTSDKLKAAKKPLVISGTSCKNESILQAAYNVALALKKVNDKTGISLTVPEADSFGLAILETESFEDAVNVKANDLIILENDLYRRADKNTVDKFLKRFENVVVLDYFKTETTEKANVVIPTGTFAESDGTLVNNEGRAQRFYQVYSPEADIQEAWRWLNEFNQKSKKTRINLFEVIDEIKKEFPLLKDIDQITPPPGFRIAGQKIPRETHRYSGRTAIHANENVSEHKPLEDPDSPLTFTMEGYHGKPPASIIPYFWSPGWNSEQSINKYQIEVGGPLHGGDPGIRLFEAESSSKLRFFEQIPPRSSKQENEFDFVPVYTFYGSEEFSSKSSTAKEMIPEPYVLLNAEDVNKLKAAKNDKVKISVEGKELSLPIKISFEIPEGVAGLPVGLTAIPYLNYTSSGKISGAANG